MATPFMPVTAPASSMAGSIAWTAQRIGRTHPDLLPLQPMPVHVMTDTRHLPARNRHVIALLKERKATLPDEYTTSRCHPAPKA